MQKKTKKVLTVIVRILVIAVDVALVPGLIYCRWLSEQMLATESRCLLLQFNGQCLSCGGTHFVRDLLYGRIFDAFMDNQFFFICTAFLFVSLIAVNLWVLFKLEFAKKMLKYMYSIPTLIITFLILVLFLVLRNIQMIAYFSELAVKIGTEVGESIQKNDWEGAMNNPTFWDTVKRLFPPIRLFK